MLGPKSINSSGVSRTSIRSASSLGGSGLAKTKLPTSSTASSARQATSSAALRQASQCSLLAAGKSTSRSSLQSETASITSSTTSCNSRRVAGAKSATSCQPKASSSSKSTSTSTGGALSALQIKRPKTGPSSVASTASSSSASASVSAGSLTSSTQINGRRVPTLAMSLRDKDQQIKLLIKERDEQKFQAELMTRKAEEFEEKFVQSELEKSHVTSEADDEVVELRRLTQELEDENKKLAIKCGEREQLISDIQFKIDEMEIERANLKRELDYKEEQLSAMELDQREVANGKPIVQVNTERSISRAKYEREIEELKEKILGRDEQMIQLRSSLEMRKNEVCNLQSRAADLERKLKIESERSERHLKRIDEINLELKAAEAKLVSKGEENEIYEKQVRQLRQELRAAEEKLEQLSLARKKDVDVLHNKLTAARRGSSTPTSPQPFKTPTPQDEIVRWQMEIRDLKDQLIDREAELDCNRRDLEVMKRKMETRTLEVDCNNQELARRCQDLLEQNRQSEETVKQLLMSTTEHSAQLMRATEDLKEANGKCSKLREEIGELEQKLEEQLRKCGQLARENGQLKDENEDYREQVEMLRQQVSSLNEQLSDLCDQLDTQTNNLHKDRVALADQLSRSDIESAQMRHDLATAKQDIRTAKLQTQEVASERDRLITELAIKEKYIKSRNDIIEALRHELEDCKRSLAEYKVKIEELRQSAMEEEKKLGKDMRAQLEALKRDLQVKSEESAALRAKCDQLQRKADEQRSAGDEEELKRFDEMRAKHRLEVDELTLKLEHLEEQLEEARSETLKRVKEESKPGELANAAPASPGEVGGGQLAAEENADGAKVQRGEDYETQIEFLNSLVVDMQRKCDDYKSQLAQMETSSLMNEFDTLISSSAAKLSKPKEQSSISRPSTLKRTSGGGKQGENANGASKVTFDATATLTRHSNSVGSSSKAQRAGMIEKPSRISGRPYCDICNIYDLHHTVYCPKVSEKLAARHEMNAGESNNNDTTTSISNNNNNNNNSFTVDDLFREYEQSIQVESARQFLSLRRRQDIEKPPRPYCDHCDLFGHTIKSCGSLKV